MIEKVVAARNLTNACKKVIQNKGSAGIDGMTVDKLKAFIDAHRLEVVSQLISKSYIPQAIKGVEPKRSERMSTFKNQIIKANKYPSQRAKPDYWECPRW